LAGAGRNRRIGFGPRGVGASVHPERLEGLRDKVEKKRGFSLDLRRMIRARLSLATIHQPLAFRQIDISIEPLLGVQKQMFRPEWP
jgi:hypothetical protein